MNQKQDFQYQKTELRKGVRIHTVTTDRFKSAFLSVNFFLPLTLKDYPVNSLLCDVLTRGTEKHPTLRELNRATDELYSLSLNAYSKHIGETQVVSFELSCIEDDFTIGKMPILRDSVSLLKEVLFSPLKEEGSFVKSYVRQEKKNMTDAILARINNKDRYAFYRCLEHMCADEAYSVPARVLPASVARITGRQLTAAHRRLLQEAPVEIFYTGRKSAEEITDMFSDMPLPERRSFAIGSPEPVHPETFRVIRETSGIEQCKLVIGFRTERIKTPLERASLSLFHEIFSTSPVSRLFVNVREKQSLCYYCAGTPDPYKGVYFVSSGTKNSNYQRVCDSVMNQLEAIRKSGVTEEELTLGKKSIWHGIRESADSAYSISVSCLHSVLRNQIPGIGRRIDLIGSVKAEDVVETARSLEPDTFYVLEGGMANE